MEAEGGVGEVSGVRNHSTGETPEGRRSEGGYVVGNAWAGLVMGERGQFSYRRVSQRVGYRWNCLTSVPPRANAGSGGS